MSRDPNRLARRQALRLGLGAAAALALAPRSLRAAAPGRRMLGFENLHTGERLSVTYWADGAYLPEALRSIDVVLRDHRTGDVRTMEPGVIDLLHRLRLALETTAPFQVISGYRSPRTNAMLASQSSGVAKESLHTRGLAVDIRVPGRALKDVRDAALRLQAGGVGFYPKSDFVHVDIGRVRAW